MENNKDIIFKIVIFGVSLLLLWGLKTYIKPNTSSLQDYYPLEEPATIEYNTYFIRYGPLGAELNFQGFIEFKKTTEIIIANDNTIVKVKQLSFINRGDIIAIVSGEDIISEIDGYVLNIGFTENIVLEVLEYKDIIIKATLQHSDFIRLNLEDNFKFHFEQASTSLKLNSWYFDSELITYVLEFSNLPKDSRYLHNSVINISQETILHSVYSIPNFLLTNEVEPNKYEVLIYNPTLKENNVYTKIIEVKHTPQYSNSEIVSNNIELYEQIIFSID